MNNVNYNLEMENIIKSLKGQRPRLLLHSCCGPCSSGCIERLNEFFDITVYYYNPNLDTSDEFLRRAEEQAKLLKEMDLKYDMDLVVVDYNSNEYYSKIKGLEKESEGGKRCSECFDLRLRKSAEYAAENGFEYFTTTLSISPYKNAKLLNELGEEIANEYGIKYLYSDFKKKDGYKRSIELSKEYNMYRQDYCGCIYSKVEAEERRKESL